MVLGEGSSISFANGDRIVFPLSESDRATLTKADGTVISVFQLEYKDEYFKDIGLKLPCDVLLNDLVR